MNLQETFVLANHLGNGRRMGNSKRGSKLTCRSLVPGNDATKIVEKYNEFVSEKVTARKDVYTATLKDMI